MKKIYVKMVHVWMQDEWIDRWMNGRMHAQMGDGWMGLWVDKQMDECAGLQPIEEGQGMRKCATIGLS